MLLVQEAGGDSEFVKVVADLFLVYYSSVLIVADIFPPDWVGFEEYQNLMLASERYPLLEPNPWAALGLTEPPLDM